MKCASYAILLLFGGGGLVFAHDLFLKLDAYVLAPRARARVWVFNGTFERSEATVARNRVVEIALLTPGGRRHVSVEKWQEESVHSLFEIETEEAGTYVVGVALAPREITLTAEQFNAYLEHEGLLDVLAWRRQRGELNKGARERYTKYAKMIFQVGERRTDTFRQPFGYPVEILLEGHPSDLRVGGVLRVRCLKDGRPLPQQVVLAGWEGGQPLSARTDAEGIARFEIKKAGKWYVKFIHIVPISEANLDYESWWATLTFEVRPRS
ncbi:MAG: DUF4198 domain-containing protein [Blastocatellia bacterium]|nr:DUF4198 domain-containing protein [Blastocatellia bacterium]MCS7158013.1 DUF4198 domain-containing protein [Blastocatellia bacterium]MCX7752520.1 DUF4198 domain-containing protein [Blastocatellia bacterium]MDW8167365.1 DUF4198 domain-containing protein [Acidobacteriota bacterium]MDW8257310.1 DUF4198 domain-containing protein [Acidobacteriota bacterium]